MGTRAIVGYYNSVNNTYRSVYTHWDGYPSHHLAILVNHYNTITAIKKLVAGGAISVLDKSIDAPYGHSFYNRVKGYTVYYGRDRGDKNVGAKTTATPERFTHEEYGYIFKDDQWYVVNPSTFRLNPASDFWNGSEYQDETLRDNPIII